MLSIMNRALEPSARYQERVLFLTSVGLNRSICSDVAQVVEKITDMVTSTDTRLQGLAVLEIVLKGNFAEFMQDRWLLILLEILKDHNSSTIVKEHACRILCVLLPFFSKDPASIHVDPTKFVKELILLLLADINENAEWTESAGKCVLACLQSFPNLSEAYKDKLMSVILKQVMCCVSSKTFEVFADCFSEIPNCTKSRSQELYKDTWRMHYLITLNSLFDALHSLLSSLMDDAVDHRIPNIDVFPFEDVEENESNPKSDLFTSHFKTMCQFINLSKCLAKLLTKKSKYPVDIPLQDTLALVSDLFNVPEKIPLIKTSSLELQLSVLTLAQMQAAGLLLLEALMSNLDLIKYSSFILSVLKSALKASTSPISGESISEFRLATWQIVDMWLTKQGNKVSNDIAADSSDILDELFDDISPKAEEDLFQSNSTQGHQKSKKIAPKPPKTKSYHEKMNDHLLCSEALKILENLVNTGEAINKSQYKQIYDKIMEFSHCISIAQNFPPPYDDSSCRKNLYSVLLTIVTVKNPESIDEAQNVECAASVFKRAMADPSPEVVKLCHSAAGIFRKHLSSIRPLSSKEATRRLNVSREIRKKSWAKHIYIPNLPVEIVPEVSQNSSRVEQAFHNDKEMHIDEYDRKIEQCYSEEISESQCNGEEEVQSSSQCQEVESEDVDEEDEEDDEDEDEDEEEERSYGEEEMNQDENMFSSGKLQSLNPVHTNQESAQTLVESEYESLRPCARTETNAMDNSKNIHLNGVHSIVPDEDAVTTSSNQPTIASENGIYDEEMEDEGNADIVEGEEESATFPAEKRIPELCDPPSKRQKMETNEVIEDVQKDEKECRSQSPTLNEMKADFVCNEVDDVKS